MNFFLRLSDMFARGGAFVFVFFAIASSLAAVFFYIARPDFLTVMDLKALDVMFKQRPVKTPPDSVAIVAVDEKSVNELGRWPWQRIQMASLIKGLGEAKVVALDMVFSEREDPKNDLALAEAIKDADNVVLGYFFRDDFTESPKEKTLAQLERSRIGILHFVDTEELPTSEIMIEEFRGIETNIEEIGGWAKGFGSFNILPGDDGTYRVSNLAYRYRDNLYPALSVEALRRYSGSDVVFTVGPYGMVEGLVIGKTVVPLNEDGGFQLNFYGQGGTFKTYPAVDVIKGRLPEGTFKDKIVFVGATEKAIYDIRVTPVDPVYPGVEVHATVAGNILEKRFLISDYRVHLLNLFFVVFFPLAISILFSRIHSAYAGLGIFITFISAIISLVVYLFSSFSFVLSAVYPVFSITLAYLSIEAYRNIVTERKSKFYKKAFSTYVPPEVVAEIIKNPERLKLGGEKRMVTVLFSDIRGFTGLSEMLEPERLVALLNEYLTPMTEIVFKEGGTLDKYIGDAIMALFNAPIEFADHPKRACRVALNMVENMPGLNREWERRGLPSLFIGVGINTGEAVVGNMGAELRFDYTAIGDTVNLASRLEGMNKLYSTSIVVSEFTYRQCKDDFVFRELDYVRVKGKEKPSGIFELMGFKGSATAVIPDIFKAALTDFRKGKFKTAKKGFEEILSKFPDDGPSLIYVQRCEEYIISPPPADWDGVYVAKTK